jgi:hypothetical protein
MRKFAPFIAGSIALALAAYGDTDDTTGVQTETNEPAPVVTATETTVIDRDANRDSVTVNRNGLQVDVDSGGTSIRADIGDDPSVTVRD